MEQDLFQKLIVAKLDKHFHHLYKKNLPSLLEIVGEINPDQTLELYLFKIHMSFHLRLGLPSSLFPSRFPTKYCINISPPHLSTCLACIILLHSYILTIFV